MSVKKKIANSKPVDVQPEKGFFYLIKQSRTWGFILTVIGIGSMFYYYTVRKNTEQAEYHLGYVAGMVYRQLEGYKMVCAAYDTKLQVYPRRFQEKYHNEIQKIADAAKKRGYSLDEIFAEIGQNTALKNKMQGDVKLEMDGMRRQIILAAVQETNGDNGSPVWNDSYDGLLTMQGLCQNIDEYPEEYLNIYNDTTYSKLKKLLEKI